MSTSTASAHELQKIAPTYRDNQMTVNGKIYGFPDDGDVFIMYYRKDIFARDDLQEGLQGEVQVRSRAAQDLEAVRRDRQLPHREAEGRRHLRRVASSASRPTPCSCSRSASATKAASSSTPHMKATVNNATGVKVFTEMRNENRFMPPGVEKFGFVENLAVFLKGESAMTISWPPYGRFAAGYLANEKALDWVPKSRSPARSVMRCRRAAIRELAAGLCVVGRLDQQAEGAAYLFIQWLNSEEISNQRVQLPYALRDPFRDSHFMNKDYLAKWPDAKDYLAALKAGCEDRPARSVADPDRQVRRGAAPGHQPAVGG